MRLIPGLNFYDFKLNLIISFITEAIGIFISQAREV